MSELEEAFKNRDWKRFKEMYYYDPSKVAPFFYDSIKNNAIEAVKFLNSYLDDDTRLKAFGDYLGRDDKN